MILRSAFRRALSLAALVTSTLSPAFAGDLNDDDFIYDELVAINDAAEKNPLRIFVDCANDRRKVTILSPGTLRDKLSKQTDDRIWDYLMRARMRAQDAEKTRPMEDGYWAIPHSDAPGAARRYVTILARRACEYGT